MHPSSICSYYPNYSILDEIKNQGNFKKFNIFIDLKNVLQATYMKHTIRNILDYSEKSNFFDTSIFASLIPYLSFHKIYALKRDIEIDFYIFFERGRSIYHKNVSKKYKISRRINTFYDLSQDKIDDFFEILKRNFELIRRAISKLPNVYVFCIEQLEADFIPYFLINYGHVEDSPEIAHILYSNDHDMFQTIKGRKNVFIYQKIGGKKKRIVRVGEIMDKVLKCKTNLSDDFFPLSLAIIGDPGDDVEGIKGIGPKSFLKNADDIFNLIGRNFDKMYDRVVDNEEIFDQTTLGIPNKILKKIIDAENEKSLISNNLKLVSFEILSKTIQDPRNTIYLTRKGEILSNISEKSVASCNLLKESLRKFGVDIEDNQFDVLYYKTPFYEV